MNVIMAYLETMFSAYPRTQRMMEAKSELQNMMEDAYAALIARGVSENEAVGKIITDFGNLDELAPELGITAEIAPATTQHTPGAASADPAAPAAPPAYAPLTRDEAERYAQTRRRTDLRLGRAVALLAVSPAALIALATLSGSPSTGLDDSIAVFIGLLVMFVCIALGVTSLVRRNQELSAFSRISDGRFNRSPSVETWAQGLAADAAPRRTVALQIAIALWIFSTIPILTVSLLPAFSEETSGAWVGVAVAGTLITVAIGLLVFLPTNWAADVAEKISRAGAAAPGTDEAEEEFGITGVIASFYWPLLTAIYLAWSFIGDAWGRSWIIWPVGAVLFGAVMAGFGVWEGASRKHRR